MLALLKDQNQDFMSSTIGDVKGWLHCIHRFSSTSYSRSGNSVTQTIEYSSLICKSSSLQSQVLIVQVHTCNIHWYLQQSNESPAWHRSFKIAFISSWVKNFGYGGFQAFSFYTMHPFPLLYIFTLLPNYLFSFLLNLITTFYIIHLTLHLCRAAWERYMKPQFATISEYLSVQGQTLCQACPNQTFPLLPCMYLG